MSYAKYMEDNWEIRQERQANYNPYHEENSRRKSTFLMQFGIRSLSPSRPVK